VDFTVDVVYFPEPTKRYEVIVESALVSDFIRPKARIVLAQFVQQTTPQANVTAGSDDDVPTPGQLIPYS
jgi:hypothetical protein